MNRRAVIWLAALAALFGLRAGGRTALCAENAKSGFDLAARVPAEARTNLYVSNRAPLVASPLVKLPIGSISPRGWLRHQLELEADGMTGHLQEISPWCRFADSAWSDPNGVGQNAWEEMPYWLKGYGDLGYVLHDQSIIRQAKRWIDAILAGQAADGWFGPKELRSSLAGKPDLWPHMPILNALQSYYEQSADPRVLPFMTNYFRWELNCPEADFLTGYWPRIRGGDNLESIYWLYNRTGEAWLLKLAEKVHRHTSDWTSGICNWHGVNITEGFREPAIFYLQARDRKFLDAAERNYQTVMGLYGQVPGGGFGADENCRPGFGDPRQGFETCSIVEFMHSFELLTRISGDAAWSDRCENLAFNTLPAALTADWKSLHYLTAPNQVQLDKGNKSPGIQNSGTMFAYSPFEVYRCCQHNVSHGWPYFAEELWLATSDRGLCASLYAASEVTAKVGNGTSVTIDEQTDYPFDGKITLRLATSKAVRFPLYLRIPKWCRAPQVSVAAPRTDGSAAKVFNLDETIGPTQPYLAIDRQWSDGDTVELNLPMHVAVRTWTKNHDSVSVDYGPLTFSLAIGERYSRYGGKGNWSEEEVFPTTPWNYGLAIDAHAPAASFELVRTRGPLPAQPFTPESAPIRLRATARQIPAWRQDSEGLVGALQASPAKTDQPPDQVELIPMGCARLRISAFPTVGDGPDAHPWRLAPRASHCFAGDTVEALDNGSLPKSSADERIPRFTWWDHRGTTEWVEYEYAEPRAVSSAEVYWFDDTGNGNCRVPASWRLLYKQGDQWKPVDAATDYPVARDRFNRSQFRAVKTTALRLEAKLQPGFSAGILQWKVD